MSIEYLAQHVSPYVEVMRFAAAAIGEGVDLDRGAHEHGAGREHPGPIPPKAFQVCAVAATCFGAPRSTGVVFVTKYDSMTSTTISVFMKQR